MKCTDVELILAVTLIAMLFLGIDSLMIAIVTVALAILMATHQMVKFERGLANETKK